MKYLLPFYLCLAILLCAGPVSAEHLGPHGTIRIGIFTFEPMNFIDEQGKAQGFNPDLLRKIAEDENWKAVFVPVSWTDGLEQLQTGEIDLMPSVSYSSERAEVMDYSYESVLELQGQAYVLPGNGIKNISDLAGKKVAVMRRDISGQNFRKTARQLKIDCEYVEVPNLAEAFAAVQRGEAAAGVAPQLYGLRHAGKYNLIPSSIQFAPFSIYFTAKTGEHHKLLSQLDSYLTHGKADKNSYYYQRLNYWLGDNRSLPFALPDWIWAVLAVVGLTTLLSFSRNLVFKSQVRRQTLELSAKEVALRQSEENYQEIFNAGSDAIFIHDAETGQILDVNQTMLDLYGYKKEQVLQLLVVDVSANVPPYTEQEVRQHLQNAIQQGPQHFEWLAKKKNKELFWVEIGLKYYQPGTAGRIIATVRDISARKQAEEALRQSEEKFSRAFKLSPDAVYINRLADGVYIEINQGFSDMTGWTADEVLGRSSQPGDLDIWCQAEERERLVAELRAHGEVVGFEAEFRHKNGGTRIGLRSARVIDIAGEPCILSMTRDITEWKRLQEKQRALEDQVLQAQKLESLGVLAGGIAHDFNNILMAVLGHCELALRRLATESPARQNIEQIKLSASKAADLSNQMLAYSGRGKFVVEPLDLSRVVEEMQQMLEISISKKAVLRYDFPPHLPSVEADVTQLRQIILNLVINASDAIGDKSGVIAITTGAMDCDRSYLQEAWLDENLPAGQYAYMEVADTGCGMERKTIDRIFEPFFSTKFTGRGLGMAAVLGIVRGHKGAIKVYSEVGKGTTFKVLLPASARPVELFNSNNPAEQLQGSGLVLLVDDDETVRTIGREMLNEFGFDVVTAADGAEAVEIFRKQHEQILFALMDLTMPHLDGEQAFREFRRIDSAAKVILCSGYNEQEVTQKFAGKGLHGFLKKPYQLSELQSAIQPLLDETID